MYTKFLRVFPGVVAIISNQIFLSRNKLKKKKRMEPKINFSL